MPPRVVIHTVPERATWTLETKSLGSPSFAVKRVSRPCSRRHNPDGVPSQRFPAVSSARLLIVSSRTWRTTDLSASLPPEGDVPVGVGTPPSGGGEEFCPALLETLPSP